MPTIRSGRGKTYSAKTAPRKRTAGRTKNTKHRSLTNRQLRIGDTRSKSTRPKTTGASNANLKNRLRPPAPLPNPNPAPPPMGQADAYNLFLRQVTQQFGISPNFSEMVTDFKGNEDDTPSMSNPAWRQSQAKLARAEFERLMKPFGGTVLKMPGGPITAPAPPPVYRPPTPGGYYGGAPGGIPWDPRNDEE